MRFYLPVGRQAFLLLTFALILFLDRIYLCDAHHIDWVGSQRCREPCLENFFRDDVGRGAQTETQDIGAIPQPRALRRFCVVAQRGANTWDFVRGNRYARARPAKQNAFVRLAARDALRDLAPEITLPEEVRVGAARALTRMLELGG